MSDQPPYPPEPPVDEYGPWPPADDFETTGDGATFPTGEPEPE